MQPMKPLCGPVFKHRQHTSLLQLVHDVNEYCGCCLSILLDTSTPGIIARARHAEVISGRAMINTKARRSAWLTPGDGYMLRFDVLSLSSVTACHTSTLYYTCNSIDLFHLL